MSELSRRAFIGATLAAACTGVALLNPSSAVAAGARVLQGKTVSSPEELMVRSTFTPLIGRTFRLAGPTGSATAELTEVGDLRGAPAGEAERFSLLFRSTGGASLPQHTYAVSNRQLGSLDLFVVPVDRGARGQTYQAIVNRAT
jgi:hypothetical protein